MPLSLYSQLLTNLLSNLLAQSHISEIVSLQTHSGTLLLHLTVYWQNKTQPSWCAFLWSRANRYNLSSNTCLFCGYSIGHVFVRKNWTFSLKTCTFFMTFNISFINLSSTNYIIHFGLSSFYVDKCSAKLIFEKQNTSLLILRYYISNTQMACSPSPVLHKSSPTPAR